MLARCWPWCTFSEGPPNAENETTTHRTHRTHRSRSRTIYFTRTLCWVCAQQDAWWKSLFIFLNNILPKHILVVRDRVLIDWASVRHWKLPPGRAQMPPGLHREACWQHHDGGIILPLYANAYNASSSQVECHSGTAARRLSGCSRHEHVTVTGYVF